MAPTRGNSAAGLKLGLAQKWPKSLHISTARKDEMSDPAKIEWPDAEWMRRLAAARGLGRAYALFPETVAAAFARASQCMSTAPPTIPSLTEPALTFDP